MKTFVLFILLTAMWIAPAAAQAPAAILMKPFQADSMLEIRAANAGRPFVLLLWSVDCPPCRRELASVDDWRTRYPELSFVIVSTDSLELRADAEAVLAEFGLDPTRTWIFADEFTERLRFNIDPDWRGELPRSYFYDRSHRARALSGVISEASLRRFTSSLGAD